jgi:hypothetical protein
MKNIKPFLAAVGGLLLMASYGYKLQKDAEVPGEKEPAKPASSSSAAPTPPKSNPSVASSAEPPPVSAPKPGAGAYSATNRPQVAAQPVVNKPDAKIGDTLDKFIARYGQPEESNAEVASFIHGPYRVMVRFNGDQGAVTVSYSMVADAAASFSQSQIDALLKKHGGGIQWKRVKTVLPQDFFVTEDGKVGAEIPVVGGPSVFAMEYAPPALRKE